ncbi:MAG: hypothetical protein M0006_14795 [Magnetospirillum sp.]|nr:hypothetical protein [Magnetospirillum sp.]
MFRPSLLLAICFLASSPAFAGGGATVQALPTADGPRLVLGGVDLGLAQDHTPMYGASQGLSFGAVSGPHDGEKLALGGYVAYAVDDYLLSSSLHNTAIGSMADLAAAYTGSVLGYQGTASLKMGYGWMRSSVFNPDATDLGLQGIEPFQSSMALALSWSHPVTPNLSLNGFAAATRTAAPDESSLSGVHLGAGFGIRF